MRTIVDKELTAKIEDIVTYCNKSPYTTDSNTYLEAKMQNLFTGKANIDFNNNDVINTIIPKLTNMLFRIAVYGWLNERKITFQPSAKSAIALSIQDIRSELTKQYTDITILMHDIDIAFAEIQDESSNNIINEDYTAREKLEYLRVCLNTNHDFGFNLLTIEGDFLCYKYKTTTEEKKEPKQLVNLNKLQYSDINKLMCFNIKKEIVMCWIAKEDPQKNSLTNIQYIDWDKLSPMLDYNDFILLLKAGNKIKLPEEKKEYRNFTIKKVEKSALGFWNKFWLILQYPSDNTNITSFIINYLFGEKSSIPTNTGSGMSSWKSAQLKTIELDESTSLSEKPTLIENPQPNNDTANSGEKISNK